MGYGLIVVYVYVVLWVPANRVASQGMLGYAGIVGVFMAVGTSFGLVSLAGVKFNTTVPALLFLLL